MSLIPNEQRVRQDGPLLAALGRMRVLGIGHDCDLGAMYQRLQAEGHAVRVHIAEQDSRELFNGLLTQTEDFRADLPWVREAGEDGLILFEGTRWGRLQDSLRRDGFRVVGGSELGDKLEGSRPYGQEVLGRCGLRIAKSVTFDSFEQGLAWLGEHPQRCVLKFNGHGFASTRTYVGKLEDGSDVKAVLQITRDRWQEEAPSFVLMEHVRGVEVGVGAFFNGREFMYPANLDWEHKHFFPGDLGELTGEMGTVATYEGAQPLFEASLVKLAPLLRESGYCGYINLNTIVNAQGIWPLELTCRFGYPGFMVLDALHIDSWGELLQNLCQGGTTFRTHAGYSIAVVLSVPPFPYRDGYERLSKGMPICFRGELSEDEQAHVHYGEVALAAGQLVTSGVIGYALVVTGRAPEVEGARSRAYALVDKVVIPNMRYRADIGERVIRTDLVALERLGWISNKTTV